MANRWGNSGWLFFWAPKSLQMVLDAMKFKKCLFLGRKVMTNLDSILKSRDITLPTKVHLVKASIHVWMWQLDYKETWVLKNWYFWTVVLKKTLESPLDCKEIQPVHPKGDQPWVFIGRNDAKAKTPVLWPPHAKCWLIGKDSMLVGIRGRRRRGKSGSRDRSFLGLQNHCGWWLQFEIKRCLLFGRKVMTNLDSILNSRDITFPQRSI